VAGTSQPSVLWPVTQETISHAVHSGSCRRRPRSPPCRRQSLLLSRDPPPPISIPACEPAPLNGEWLRFRRQSDPGRRFSCRTGALLTGRSGQAPMIGVKGGSTPSVIELSNVRLDGGGESSHIYLPPQGPRQSGLTAQIPFSFADHLNAEHPHWK